MGRRGWLFDPEVRRPAFSFHDFQLVVWLESPAAIKTVLRTPGSWRVRFFMPDDALRIMKKRVQQSHIVRHENVFALFPYRAALPPRNMGASRAGWRVPPARAFADS